MTGSKPQRPAPKTIRQDRVRRVRDLAASLPAFPGDLTDDIEPTPDAHLMTGEGAIDAFNMATVYGVRTDGCGSVGCIAGLTVQEYPDVAARTRRRIAREYNRPINGVDILDVAGDILGLDHTTRNELFCAVSSPWADDLGPSLQGGRHRRPRPHPRRPPGPRHLDTRPPRIHHRPTLSPAALPHAPPPDTPSRRHHTTARSPTMLTPLRAILTLRQWRAPRAASTPPHTRAARRRAARRATYRTDRHGVIRRAHPKPRPRRRRPTS